jgi:hypothetical protein
MNTGILLEITVNNKLYYLGTNHLWRERIKICAKEGNCTSPRGNNSKRMKMH